MEQMKEEIVRARAQLSQLQEEARVSGQPPPPNNPTYIGSFLSHKRDINYPPPPPAIGVPMVKPEVRRGRLGW